MTKTDAEHWQHYQQLKQTNPHAAALYVNEHGDAIFRGRVVPITNPTTEQRDDASIAASLAARQIATTQAQAEAAALVAHRTYEALRATNPHAAVLMMNAQHAAIHRGRELAAAVPPEPEPPQAA